MNFTTLCDYKSLCMNYADFIAGGTTIDGYYIFVCADCLKELINTKAGLAYIFIPGDTGDRETAKEAFFRFLRFLCDKGSSALSH